jgi:hypothetical protein
MLAFGETGTGLQHRLGGGSHHPGYPMFGASIEVEQGLYFFANRHGNLPLRVVFFALGNGTVCHLAKDRDNVQVHGSSNRACDPNLQHHYRLER